jgi:hypothetical protein
MKRTLTTAMAAALGATASTAAAVMLSPRGTGQVLIYPYYTVNHQQTLVSVINTTAHGKALKVRFREGYDGRDVANFNVYLGPYDSWVGAVYDSSSDGTGAAAIATNDNSCTVPAFPLAPVPGILHALTFSNANYSQGDYGTPTGTDHGPTNLARTREGFFEIIEMGEVVDQASGSQKTLEAITPVNAAPPGCAQLRNAWATGGYWTTNANTDLLPPAGGVYGAAGLVNVAQGTLYAYDATAIDGFSDVVQHSAPGNSRPHLGTAVTDSALGVATAYVPIGNAMLKSDYPATARGVDAVSAVLMAGVLANEYDTDPRVGASSEWVITFPTKQFYVDPAIVGTTPLGALAPFEETFGGSGTSCSTTDPTSYDRAGNPPGPSLPPPEGGYVADGKHLCYESQLFTFNQAGVEQGVPTRVFGSLLGADYEAYTNGWLALSFKDPTEQLRASLEGNVFFGLPAVGFLAANYINTNVTPGVLSNYSGVYPHRSTASCMNSTNPQSACQ